MMRPWIKKLMRWLLAAAIGSTLTALAIFVWSLERRDDLDPWHSTELENEFTARGDVVDFQGYLALEDALFRELDKKIYDRTGPVGNDMTNRYRRGSLADPARWSMNWNRSFRLGDPDASRAVLLLHGMSDSPYSLRRIGEALAAQGAHVIGLRLPGHGTIPSGLVRLRLPDLQAAVRLAVDELLRSNPQARFEIVGYSNGAALALDYTVQSLSATQARPPDRLVLISPAIAVTGLARFAVWQARLGTLLGLDKLAWNDILIEYDPYKYNSFAVNAGDVTYRLTREVARGLARLEAEGRLAAFPPVTTFLSAVDGTVLAPAVVSVLYDRLPGAQHELVLFDVNRRAQESNLLRWDPDQLIGPLSQDAGRRFTLSVIRNSEPAARQTSWLRYAPGQASPRVTALGISWPDNIYSLSHVALPFGPDDPLYGAQPQAPDERIIHLGALAARGERNVLRIPSAAMLRQRWNPFYDWMLLRIVEETGHGALD